ncbi:hypothetical protein FD755_019902, partial [Muntiacus reevesi]
NRSKRLEKVHVVIGHKSCDLDSLISAFTYAYFLDKVSPPGVLCLPVLNIPRTEFSYFTETRFILEELNISESFHIFRDEINLHQLNDEGKLSLTLVGSNVLASEDKTLESAVVKVINPVEQGDAGFEFREPSSSLVVKEILQEAPEVITEQLAHLLRESEAKQDIWEVIPGNTDRAFIPLRTSGKECKIALQCFPTRGVQWHVGTCLSELQELTAKFSGILCVG